MDKQEKVFWHRDQMYIVTVGVIAFVWLARVDSTMKDLSFANWYEQAISCDEVFQEYLNPETRKNFFCPVFD